MYLEKDVARGVDGTFMWLMEEVGELASALREGTHEERAAEFADVLAWLTTIANVVGVDLTEAVVAEVRGRLSGLRPVRVYLSGCRKTMSRPTDVPLPARSARRAAGRRSPGAAGPGAAARAAATEGPSPVSAGRRLSASAWDLAGNTRWARGRRSR